MEGSGISIDKIGNSCGDCLDSTSAPLLKTEIVKAGSGTGCLSPNIVKDTSIIDVSNQIKNNGKRVNGLVIPVLKSQDEYEHTESADSGHGSSCQDCECGSGETEVTILSEGLGAVSLDNQLSESETEILRSPLDVIDGINYVVYESEHQMPEIMRLITKDLSEPYSIYTYRYFIHNWPRLCFLAKDVDKCVGAIVCKLDMHKKMVRRGYIAMLAIDSDFRRRKIGSNLVTKAIRAMMADDCDEVVLETEITNKAALKLYENLGFVRDKRLFRYYLNGVDALRLKLWLR
ncbi:N-alpha-acetyltransferase 30 [Patella vulgata]|uniref:N-alpha-acetyltransferase 30 n=1 Tax=Patella vulgata TaxID=6465 RepID=UPI00217F272C|nr:N-alpha-acetyltransferase 30 [Patella vulgata]